MLSPLVPFDPSTKELVLGEIFEVLCDIAYMWKELSAFLGIPHHMIFEMCMGDVDMYMYKVEGLLLPVLCEWICSKPEEATIDNLISAIGTLYGGHGGLAHRIEDRIMDKMARYQQGT